MELGLFSPCCDVEKLPPPPFLDHMRTEGEDRRESQIPWLAPLRQRPFSVVVLNGDKALIPPRRAQRGVWASLSPLPFHPPVFLDHKEKLSPSATQPRLPGLLYPSVVTFSSALPRGFPVFRGIR